jgi:hypothetical protein
LAIPQAGDHRTASRWHRPRKLLHPPQIRWLIEYRHPGCAKGLAATNERGGELLAG